MSQTPCATSPASASSILAKAFDVLHTFTHDRPVLTLSEIARRSGMPKSTVHRLLAMLLELQAVEREGRGYKVGIRMFTVGETSADVRLREFARPHLEQLRRATRQTVHLAVLEGQDAIYLEKLTSGESPLTPAVIGGRMPAHRTGVGKALLAFRVSSSTSGRGTEPSLPDSAVARLAGTLEHVRRHGIAYDHEEAARGLSCVAAPVLLGGRAVAAVSVAFRSEEGSGERFINPVRQAAGAMARSIGNSPRLAS